VTWRVRSLWIWPALAVVAVAVAGQIFGVLGAAIALGQVVATAIAFTGERLLDRGWRPWVLVAALVSGGLLAVLLSGPSRPDHVADLRGRTVTPDMLPADLNGAQLAGAKLAELDLRDQSLAGASAQGASFSRSRLDGVSLRGADLRGADFSGACLRGADFDGAILTGAVISGADLVLETLPPDVRKTLVGKPARSTPDRCR
jgi:hypothetical protein